MLLHIRLMNIYQHFKLLIEQPFSYKLLHEFCMACKFVGPEGFEPTITWM